MSLFPPNALPRPRECFRRASFVAREPELARLAQNIAGTLKDVHRAIQDTMIGHLTRADPAYGAGVTEALGLA